MPENPLPGPGFESVAIIGAGIAGLACAQTLAKQGIHVTLFDKARGPGGRMSSKRRPSAVLDLGAQTFTVRDARFRTLVDSLEADGVVGRWPHACYRVVESGWKAISDDQPRYTGSPRMSAVTRELLNRVTRFDHVRTHFETRITVLEKADESGGWRLVEQQGGAFATFDAVVITIPPPQALPLVEPWDVTLGRACQTRAQRSCWAGYVVFESPLPAFKGIKCWDSLHAEHPVLRLVSRNQTKPGREHQPESLSLLAQLDWSDAHVEKSAREAACALYAAFRSMLPKGVALPPIVELGAHRWRYSQAASPSRQSYLYSPQRLALAGESFRGSRVEDAWLSGNELANALIALPES